jgi:putative Mg2+ transporter-C (MgtC) family protein
MDFFLSFLEIPLRLILAAVIGGILGYEREQKEKPAGLRTHMMVALGSACFTMVGFEIYTSVENASSSDPIRVVEGVAGGIGFLGAGVILRTGSSISGLTTAGSIWLVGAIGVACGGGQYGLGLTAAVVAFVILHLIPMAAPEHSTSGDGESKDSARN